MSAKTIWANNLTQTYLKGLPEESKRAELTDYGYEEDMLAPLSNEELDKLIDEDDYMWQIDAEDLENKIIPNINSQTKDGLVKFYSETNPEKSYIDYAESMIDPSMGGNPNAQFLTALDDVDGKVVATFEDGTQYTLYAINDNDEDIPITANLNEGKEQLTEAKVKDPEGLTTELEEIKPLADEYGFEYFTSMPLVNYDNDPTSVEYQYPNFFKIIKAFFTEMDIVDDENNIDELEDNWATFSQRDWDTCMTVCERCLETGKSYQIEKIYAATDNDEVEDNTPVENPIDGDEMVNLEENKLNEAETNVFTNCYLGVCINLNTGIDTATATNEIKDLLNIPDDADISNDEEPADDGYVWITFEWMDNKKYLSDDEIGKYTEEGRVQEEDEKALKNLSYVEDIDMFYDERDEFDESASKIKLNEGNAPTILDDIRGYYLDDELIVNELMAYLPQSKREEILESICKDYDFLMDYENSFSTWQEIWSTLGSEEFLDNIVIKMSTEDLNKFAQRLIELYDLDELNETLIQKVRDKRKAIKAQMNESEEPAVVKTPEEQLQEDLDTILKEKNDAIIKHYKKYAGIKPDALVPADEELSENAAGRTCREYNISKDTLKEVLFKENI